MSAQEEIAAEERSLYQSMHSAASFSYFNERSPPGHEKIDGCVGLVVAVSSHESATFWGRGGHFCGRVARLATRQRLLHLSSPIHLSPHPPLALWREQRSDRCTNRCTLLPSLFLQRAVHPAKYLQEYLAHKTPLLPQDRHGALRICLR
jgi:hypothetical protein